MEVDYRAILKKHNIDISVLPEKIQWFANEIDKVDKNPVSYDKKGVFHPGTAKKVTYYNEIIIEAIYVYLLDQEEMAEIERQRLEAEQEENVRKANQQAEEAKEAEEAETKRKETEEAAQAKAAAEEREKKKLKLKWPGRIN